MHPNSYHFSKDPLYHRHTSYIVPKGSPLQVVQTINSLINWHIVESIIELIILKDKLKETITWLKDTGILEKVKYDVMNPPIPVPKAMVRQNQPLILRQLGIIMIILVVGLFIATIVFLLELLKKPELKNASKEEGGFEMSTV